MKSREELQPWSVWYHPKTEGKYVVLGTATCSTNGGEDVESVVYVSTNTGKLYYRQVQEFLDGRFVKIQ